MAEGYLQGESVRPMSPANLVWFDKGEGWSFNLTSAGRFAWSDSPRLPGFVCEACGLLQVRFEPGPDLEADPKTKRERPPGGDVRG